jgi:tetratricopeptide (TPR) repeat protein
LPISLMALALVCSTSNAQTSPSARSKAAYSTLARGFEHLRSKSYDAAIDAFIEVLELTPERNDVRKNLAYTYFKVGRNELARMQFAEIVRRDSSDHASALELAYLDYESPESAKKADAYRLFKSLRTSPDSAIRSSAQVAFASADTALAERMALWGHAMRQEPENDLMSIQFARAAEERGLAGIAEQYYRGSTREFKTEWLSVARLARGAGRIGEAEEAERHAIESGNPFLAEQVREDAAVRTGKTPPELTPPPPLPRLPATGYAILGDSAGSWPAILTAGGFTADSKTAGLLVVRSSHRVGNVKWEKLVKEGAFLVLEGVSPVAELFGFTSSGDSIEARVERDVHATERVILWEHAAYIPRVSLPSGASTFARERWNGSPLIAGYRLGKGGVLWVAANPGPKGFERLPYLLLALSDLGMTPSLRGREMQVLMDWSYRTRVDPEYLALQWHRMGVGTVHISAWYFFERDSARDAKLRAVIDAAHRNGILVYAWFQFPHVSDQFWNAHPEWREKNALLQDAAIYWRKNMNLAHPEAFQAVASGVTQLVTEFPFDGVNLSELYFEGPAGLSNLAEVSPLNVDVRRDVREQSGFDPADLFDPTSLRYYTRNPEGLRAYQDYRVALEYRLHVQFLDLFAHLRGALGSLGISIIYLDDVFEPSMRQLVGADARRILALIPKYNFTFIPEDAAMLWSLGPERYSRMASQYAELTNRADKLGVDINIVARPVLAFPTNQQTGTEFLQLINVARNSFRTVMLYAENSILPPDIPMLAPASASVSELTIAPNNMRVDSRYGVGVRWAGPAFVDGKAWAYSDGGVVWLPAGQHVITRPPRNAVRPRTRLVDFNGEIKTVTATARGLDLTFKAEARAIAILDRTPVTMRIDGVVTAMETLKRADATVVLLPGGSHKVEFVTH